MEKKNGNSKEQAVAFLDLLAFSNNVRENMEDAMSAIEHYNTILHTKLLNEAVYTRKPPVPALEDIANERRIFSFDNFLPFSDSVFISATDPNLFLKQIGSFILNCFQLTSRNYQQPLDVRRPFVVKVGGSESSWYPTLFRGGIAWGEVYPLNLISIIDRQSQMIRNLAGKAVVTAVGLEQKVKGPRIVLEQNYFDLLDEPTRRYVQATEIKGIYEILWPSFLYISVNGESEITRFNELFLPAVNFWKAYNHSPYSAHYFKFIELIVDSSIKTFEGIGLTEKCVKHINEQIKNAGLETKAKELLKAYYPL